ncbi:carbohydrate binding family 9 domain-containing protein [Candidatus Poribacteria bacterium]|nr:carbohydrate binding family 9 domain-containing protein [Candidatus Poribacteria bacterium]MYG05458.1 carbohydrate binding family 9 domain-containing protein [Candidatus Poribacteria bacterium]MYK23460.1 carbohydrate binding family 9 domain-containing protein [Candidatus Poribacteria bacterium]
MKAILSFSVIFILFFITGCEVLRQKGSIDLEDIFEALDAGALAMKQQNAKALRAVKIDEPPVIDGKLNDPAWQNAPQGTDFSDRRAGGAAAEDQSTIMMVYTDEAIYFAGYFFDSEPGGIVARQVEDQIRPFGEDWISLTIDPFHTHQFQDRTFFMANAIGSKFVSHPPPFADPTEISGMWTAAASIVDDGWIVEMEIPWEMLNYPETTEPIDIGINVDRGHHRTGANTWWSKVDFVEDDRVDGHWIGVLPPPKLPILRDDQ